MSRPKCCKELVPNQGSGRPIDMATIKIGDLVRPKRGSDMSSTFRRHGPIGHSGAFMAACSEMDGEVRFIGDGYLRVRFTDYDSSFAYYFDPEDLETA